MNPPSPLTGNHPWVRWLNALRAYCIANQVRSVAGASMERGAQGTLIKVRGSAAGGTTTETGGILKTCTLITDHEDYMTVRPSGGNVDGSEDFDIAKPPLLRQIASRSVDGSTISYTYSSVKTRVATISGVSETEVIVPCYNDGDTLFYAEADATGVAQAPTKIDVNVDGRAWARKYNQ